MGWLILGVLLWGVSHEFKRLAPDLRASMGNAGKGLVAVGSLVALWLMVKGYKAAEPTPLWQLGDWATYLNNLLMVPAVALMGVGKSKSRLRGMIRHPMLTGLLVWVVAHLLVNGDLPSLVLFGGLGVWAVLSMRMINRAEPDYVPYTEGSVKGDIRLAVITIVLFALIGGVHTWLGVNPFGGGGA